MVAITKTDRVTTLINVFTLEPANQPHLVKMLVEATNEIMKHLPGFISTSIHASTDGTRVINYAQWRSREDFEAMLKNPEAQAHMKAIAEFAEPDAHLYGVAQVIEHNTNSRWLEAQV
jgi:heme-degrading monooxygenase HmoA